MAEVNELLESIRRAAEVDAEGTYRVLDNHLLHTDRVIGNLAALRAATVDETQLAALLGAVSANPT